MDHPGDWPATPRQQAHLRVVRLATLLVYQSAELTSISDAKGRTATGTLTYSYDADGRVASRGGTLFQSVLPASMAGAVYDPDNRLCAWNSASGTCATPAITWDQDGNLVNDGTHAYSWDARNRLSSITGYGTSYIYDALGRRLSTTKGGTTTFNVYDVANLLQEAKTGAVIANLFNGLGIDERFSRTVVSTGGTASYLTDTLGSTVALANGSGAVVTNYAYDPYGVTTSSGTANTSTYQYTGRENDGTGLYYDRARYYNPAWGRFISEDPIGFGGGINKFAYAWNSPVNFTDPSGLRTVPGIPPGSKLFCSPSGTPFYAPPGTDFNNVYSAGQNNGLDPFAINSNVGQGGTYDFQRSNGDFYPAYTDASNYGVGVYMNGAGYSLNWTNEIGAAFWELFSSGNLQNKGYWWDQGWNAANSGNSNGPTPTPPSRPSHC